MGRESCVLLANPTDPSLLIFEASIASRVFPFHSTWPGSTVPAVRHGNVRYGPGRTQRMHIEVDRQARQSGGNQRKAAVAPSIPRSPLQGIPCRSAQCVARTVLWEDATRASEQRP